MGYDKSLILLNEVQLEPQPRGPDIEDWFSSEVMGPAHASNRP